MEKYYLGSLIVDKNPRSSPMYSQYGNEHSLAQTLVIMLVHCWYKHLSLLAGASINPANRMEQTEDPLPNRILDRLDGAMLRPITDKVMIPISNKS